VKWDKKTIASVILVVLFLGSILATGLVELLREKEEGGVDQIPEEQKQELYSAESDANVLELFPQLNIVAKPLDYDQEIIQQKFDEIEGIKNTTIQFTQEDENNFFVMINANIDGEKKEDVEKNILAIDVLKEIEIYQSALLKVPYTITFTNDQNKEIEQAFVSEKIEGIIKNTTKKGDQLSVMIQAIFQGESMAYIRGVEQQNLSESIQMLFSEGEFEIIGWENKFLISGITEIDNNTSTLKEIIDQNNTNIERNYLGDLIIKDNNFSLEEIIDKNGSVVLDYNKSDQELILTLDATSLDLESYNLLIKELQEQDQNLTIIQKPKTQINISFDAEKIEEDLINKINYLNITDLNIKKSAKIDVSEIIVEEKKYQYDQNITSSWLNYPEDLNKTKEIFTLQGYVSRDQIFYLNLTKKE
jgi:hypothetical protein